MMKNKNNQLTEYSIYEYAKKIKKSRQWVHRMIVDNTLNRIGAVHARKIGKTYVIAA